MRLRGVIACLYDKNAFLNCLRLTDFYPWRKASAIKEKKCKKKKKRK